MAIFFYISRGRRPRAVTVLVALAFATFTSAVIADQRYATTRTQTGFFGVAQHIASDPILVADPLLRGSDNAMAPGLAAAMVVVPSQMGYSYGLPLLRDFAARAVPRSLWAGKPRSPREQLIAAINPTGYQTHTANPEFSVLLLPYLSWGMFGALFLVAYGIFARAIYEWFRIHRRELTAQLIYALSLPLFLEAFRDNPVDSAALWLLMLLPIWMTFKLGRLRIGR